MLIAIEGPEVLEAFETMCRTPRGLRALCTGLSFGRARRHKPGEHPGMLPGRDTHWLAMRGKHGCDLRVSHLMIMLHRCCGRRSPTLLLLRPFLKRRCMMAMILHPGLDLRLPRARRGTVVGLLVMLTEDRVRVLGDMMSKEVIGMNERCSTVLRAMRC